MTATVPAASERDNGVVNTSAHRFLPPPGTSPAGVLEWWYRPIVQSPWWVALGYLTVGTIWAPLLFAIVISVLAITFSLLFVGVGLLLVVPSFVAVNSLVAIERRRAGWVGSTIPPRPFSPASTKGPRWWQRIVAVAADPTRWRQVVFTLVFLPASILLFVVGLIPWVVVIGLAFNDGLSVWSLVAVVLLGAAPRLTIATAGLERSFTAWFLGPDEAVALQGRVDELSVQRQQILDAVAAERRRIERNLHDGVQQQLVALGIDIGRATGRLDTDPDGARQLLEAASDKVRSSIGELRVIGRGLHPAVLDDRGLDAALSAVVAGSTTPMALSVDLTTPLPDDLAETAYYVVNEAVANVMKHSRARAGSVVVDTFADAARGSALRIRVNDDGRGGADLRRGSGLVGMRARVEANDGSLTITSPDGGPTTLVAVIPLDAAHHGTA